LLEKEQQKLKKEIEKEEKNVEDLKKLLNNQQLIYEKGADDLL
jgi:hypothetical protein